MKLYVAKINSDQTEGKGPMRVTGYFLSDQKAYESVKGQGVMGVGDGQVYLLEIAEDNSGDYMETLVYGYHSTGGGYGKWRHGWVDGRDLPQNDPEYKEFLRLQEKFKNL